MGVLRVCWENTCIATKDIEPCRKCHRSFCPDHLDDLTRLCMWCVPVAEDEYQKWVIEGEHEC